MSKIIAYGQRTCRHACGVWHTSFKSIEAALSREVQCRMALERCNVLVGMMEQQQHGHVLVLIAHCIVQWCLAASIDSIE